MPLVVLAAFLGAPRLKSVTLEEDSGLFPDHLLAVTELLTRSTSISKLTIVGMFPGWQVALVLCVPLGSICYFCRYRLRVGTAWRCSTPCPARALAEHIDEAGRIQ